MNKAVFFIPLLALLSCSSYNFSNVEVINVKAGPKGEFAVAYYSNQTVNVYSFEKLLRSFERKAIFISTTKQTFGGYYKITDFGFLKDGRVYVIASKPTLGWLVKVGDKEMGYYGYVTEFKSSYDGSYFGFIYNIGGNFDGTNLVGGKYFVNINGFDYGPYDYAYNLTFAEKDNTYYFIYIYKNRHFIKFNESEYGSYDYILGPKKFYNSSQKTFAYKMRGTWFLYPDKKLPQNLYSLITTENETIVLYTNSNTTIISNISNHTKLVVDGIVTDINSYKENYLVNTLLNGKKFIMRKKSICGPYDDVLAKITQNENILIEYKSNNFWYVEFKNQTYGPYKFLDTFIESNLINIVYLDNGNLGIKTISTKN
ncbi:MAG: hypothetical protein N2712_00730 [Brevinematales bacterium]|nr:hypothetical protein [Brevinematales bacterium]